MHVCCFDTERPNSDIKDNDIAVMKGTFQDFDRTARTDETTSGDERSIGH